MQSLTNLGNALTAQGDLDEAIAAYQRAVFLDPAFALARNNLGTTYRAQGKLDEAAHCFREVLRHDPAFAEAHVNLGDVLQAQGKLDQALNCYREALCLKADPAVLAVAHSNLIFLMYYQDAHDPAAIYRECQRWNERHARALAQAIEPHTNDRVRDRRLRIGYISPDFRNHALSFFIMPLLANHDRSQFEVFCYANVVRPDAITDRMRGLADVWRSIVGLTDQQVAGLVRQDQIDILVELTMHSAGNRLLVFARKPAPVQIAWLGINGTTGLSTIDCRLTDPFLDPPGCNDSVYSEETVRLPETHWCYDPLTDEPPVNALPAGDNGFFTFGCLNNFMKVNDGVLSLWARVLDSVPNSRLLLLAPRGEGRENAIASLQRLGAAHDRVTFVDHRPRPEYLRLYHDIDLGLDTFPYNGHTTGLDGLWMGVPSVTLVGKTVVGREGYSQLCNVGLQELAAETADQYVQIAVNLAGDLPRLQRLRSSLRQRMLNSPLMDAVRFVRHMERVYRQKWQGWCQGGKQNSIEMRSRRNMNSIAQTLDMAIRYHQEGNRYLAEQLYRKILDSDPENVDALHLLGVVSAQAGNREFAKDCIARAVRLNPQFAEAHFNLGNVFREAGELDEAAASYQETLRLAPNHAEAHFHLGNVRHMQGRFDEAATYLQSVLRLSPQHAKGHNSLGVVLLSQGRLDEAVDVLRQAVKLNPQLAMAHNNLGNVLKAQGKLEEAVQCYQQALRCKADYADAHYNLGVALQEQGSVTEAVESFRRALRYRPDYVEAHYNLGTLLMEQGMLGEAAACYREALRLNPDFAEAYTNLGNTLREQGRLDDAVANYRHAVAVKPQCIEARNSLGMALLEQGQIAEAVTCFEQCLQVEPKFAWRRRTLGGCTRSKATRPRPRRPIGKPCKCNRPSTWHMSA